MCDGRWKEGGAFLELTVPEVHPQWLRHKDREIDPSLGLFPAFTVGELDVVWVVRSATERAVGTMGWGLWLVG